MKIAPSILNANAGKLAEEVQRIEDGGADWLHIDIMDGHFVHNLTFGANIVEALRPTTKLFLDCHMMVDNPEDFIDPLAKAGADSMTIHVESTKHIHRLIQEVHDAGMQAGVAINPGTPVGLINPILGDVDMVLVMTVNPGAGGQSFITSCVEKVQTLNDIRKRTNAGYLIEVDGGITDKTIRSCYDAGADVFVSGSYIYKQEDVSVPIQALRQACR